MAFSTTAAVIMKLIDVVEGWEHAQCPYRIYTLSRGGQPSVSSGSARSMHLSLARGDIASSRSSSPECIESREDSVSAGGTQAMRTSYEVESRSSQSLPLTGSAVLMPGRSPPRRVMGRHDGPAEARIIPRLPP